jgi:hypothetical protein
MAAKVSGGPGGPPITASAGRASSVTASAAAGGTAVSHEVTAALESAVEALLVHVETTPEGERQHPLRFIAQHLLRARARRT